jgi:mono/diheme cytochrome c family protein
MNRQQLGLVSAVFLLLASACTHVDDHLKGSNANSSPASSPAKVDEFAATRVVFEKDCKLCHGDKGEGGPVKLDDGTKLKVPTLREGHALRHTDADFVKQITKGGDGMPAFGEKLKTEEVNDLVRFIRKEFQGGASPASTEATKAPMKP